MNKRRPRPQKVSDTCPKCGYCDKCGRANAAPVWPYPYVPYVPYAPYVVPTTTYPWFSNITISGTSTAAAQPVCNPSAYNLSGISILGSDANGIQFDPNGTVSTTGN